MRNKNDPDKFWARVHKDESDACWEWQGSRMPRGYGHLSYGGKLTYSHRVAWLLTHGEIPAGLCVLHKCDNPPCCNPAHLFIGTYHANSLDAANKGRMAHGSRSGLAKLSEENVTRIRSAYQNGASQSELGRKYGVGGSTVWYVVHGRTWSRVNA